MSRWEYDIQVDKAAPVDELVEALVAALNADFDLVAALGGKNVYAHEADPDWPNAGKRAVLREVLMIGGTRETISGIVFPSLQLKVESRDQLAAPRTLHSTLHDRAARILVGRSVVLSKSTLTQAIRRTHRAGRAMRDADEASYASASVFRCGLVPKYN